MFNTDHLSNFDLSMIHWIAVSTFLGVVLGIIVLIFQVIVLILAANRRSVINRKYGR